MLQNYLTDDFFLKLHDYSSIFFGLYRSNNTNKIVDFFLKFYCFSVCSLIIYTNRSYLAVPYAFVICLCLQLEYSFNVIVSLYTKSSYFTSFVDKIKLFDTVADFQVNGKEVKDRFLIHFFYLIVLFLWIGPSLINYHALTNFTFYFMSTAVLLGQSQRFLMFEMIWCRMKSLRKYLDDKLKSNLEYDNDNIITPSKMEIITNTLNMYKSLLDLLQSIGKTVEILLLVSILFFLPKIVAGVFGAIAHEHDLISLGPSLALAARISLVLMPAVFMEFISTEVEEIDLIISKQLIYSTDDELRFYIMDIFKFLDARPFKYCMFRTVPLDVTLIISLASLCSTYVIVWVQFSNI